MNVSCPFDHPNCLCEQGTVPLQVERLAAPRGTACTFCHAPVRGNAVVAWSDKPAPLGDTVAACAIFCTGCARRVGAAVLERRR